MLKKFSKTYSVISKVRFTLNPFFSNLILICFFWFLSLIFFDFFFLNFLSLPYWKSCRQQHLERLQLLKLYSKKNSLSRKNSVPNADPEESTLSAKKYYFFILFRTILSANNDSNSTNVPSEIRSFWQMNFP